jgi:hypothetical protein
MYGPAFKTDNASSWVTRSRQFYLQDDIVLNDTLKLGVGFKAVDFRTSGGGLGDAKDRPVNGTLRAKSNFPPHVSLFWSPTESTDAFIDLANTMNGYRVAQRGNIGYTASAWTITDQSSTACRHAAPGEELEPHRGRIASLRPVDDHRRCVLQRHPQPPAVGRHRHPVRADQHRAADAEDARDRR